MPARALPLERALEAGYRALEEERAARLKRLSSSPAAPAVPVAPLPPAPLPPPQRALHAPAEPALAEEVAVLRAELEAMKRFDRAPVPDARLEAPAAMSCVAMSFWMLVQPRSGS